MSGSLCVHVFLVLFFGLDVFVTLLMIEFLSHGEDAGKLVDAEGVERIATLEEGVGEVGVAVNIVGLDGPDS